MLKIINGPDEYTGTLEKFTPGHDSIIFTFRGGVELILPKRGEKLYNRCRTLGLRVLQNSEVNYNTGVIKIISSSTPVKPSSVPTTKVDPKTGLTQPVPRGKEDSPVLQEYMKKMNESKEGNKNVVNKVEEIKIKE